MFWFLFAVAACAAVLAFRAAMCNFRHWWRVRNLPLVLVGEDELVDAPADWGRNRRWPDPGVPGAWMLSPAHCRAYARVARIRAERQEVTETVVGLVVAALIGFLWPALSRAWTVYSEAATPFRDSATPLDVPRALLSTEGRPLVFVIALITVPAALRWVTGDFRRLARAYELAARSHALERARESTARDLGEGALGRLRLKFFGARKGRPGEAR